MTKTINKIIGMLIAAVLVGSLAACLKPSENSSESIPLSSETSSAASFSESVPVVNETAIKTQFEQVVNACKGTIDAVVAAAGDSYCDPTFDQYAAMVNAIGALGFPADWYDLNMPNYEKVQAFWADYQAGKDTQIVIYSLYNFAIDANILTCKDNAITLKDAVYKFGEGFSLTNGEFGEPIQNIDRLWMTDKGYLFYHIPSPYDGSDRYGGYRVTPLGDENRALCRKYVQALSYFCTLPYVWSQDDFSQINLSWMFKELYYQVNRKSLYDVYGMPPENNKLPLPADVVEKVMLESLPITLEQLRAGIPYDAAKKAYTVDLFAGGGGSPTPEVVQFQKNADGSLSLTIDGVWIPGGDDDRMTNVLTVMDNPDGSVKYLSNVVTKKRSE